MGQDVARHATPRGHLRSEDLVLFDPAVVADRADFGQARAQAGRHPNGWVNGRIVFENGQPTGMRAKRPLRREKALDGRLNQMNYNFTLS